jgi:sulfate/thiosulfate transport system permease protein
MSAEAVVKLPKPIATARVRRAQQDPAWVRITLIALALAVVAILIVIPVVNVFVQALRAGVATYWENLTGDPDTLHSIRLTLTVVPIALVANVLFGVAAAWALARFSFPGRSLLLALIDLPFSVSPVVAGLMFVLLFGLQGYFGRFLRDDGYVVVPYLVALVGAGLVALLVALFRPRLSGRVILVGSAVLFAALVFIQQQLGIWPRHESLKIIFATPGLILATAFVTFPFVARELIPLMEAGGPDEELAAVSLGASGWQMFWHVTVPNIKWGLVYGVILCNARAMGEFGAVYVVSGHITGETDTMPLRIEKLFQEYNLPGSFAVASLLTLLAILTLVVKARLERKAPTLARSRAPKMEHAES